MHFAQQAFRPAHSTQEVIHIIRSVIEKAKEWKHHIFIGDGAISKAYDNTERNRVVEGLLRKSCPRDLLAAIARGWRNKVKFKLGGIVTSSIQKTRALMQGDPAAPFCFKYAIDGAIETFWNFCQEQRYGIRIGTNSQSDFYLCIILFADNFWLFAKTHEELRIISEKWYGVLGTFGWSYPLDEYVYSTTVPDHKVIPEVQVNGVKITRRGHKQGIKILGTWITLDGSFEVEVGHRIHKAWGSFCKFQPVLCAFTQNLVSRIRVLDKSVKPTLFYASGSWHLTKNQIQQLSSLQFNMIRKMIRFSRRPWENTDFVYGTDQWNHKESA